MLSPRDSSYGESHRIFWCTEARPTRPYELVLGGIYEILSFVTGRVPGMHLLSYHDLGSTWSGPFFLRLCFHGIGVMTYIRIQKYKRGT